MTVRPPRLPALLAPLLVLLGTTVLSSAHAAPRTVAFAVVVGVNNSPDPALEPLIYADNDAARTYDLLDSLGVRTWVLTELDADSRRVHQRALGAAQAPTETVLRKTLRAVAEQVRRAKLSGSKTEFYFVYSGHGTTRNGHVAFALKGGSMRDDTLAGIIAGTVGADTVHYIIDACHSHVFSTLFHGPRGPGGQATLLAEGFSAVSELRRAENVGLILSTRPASGSTTYETDYFQAGVFSHVLRSGLAGPADADRNGQITYREIGAFVDRAGVAVRDRRYRPRVWARPPKGSEHLLDIRGGEGYALEVGPALGGHLYVEAEGALRIADFNKPSGRELRIRIPRYTRRFYLASADDKQEREFEGRAEVRIASLDPDQGKRARGPEGTRFRRAMEQLFQEPFLREDPGGWDYPVMALGAEPPLHRVGVTYDLHMGYLSGAGLTHGIRAGYTFRVGPVRLGGRVGWGRGTPEWDDAEDIRLDEINFVADLDVGLVSFGWLRLDAGAEVGGAALIKRGRPNGGVEQTREAWVFRALGTFGADIPVGGPMAFRLDLGLGTAVTEGLDGMRADLVGSLEAGIVMEF